MAHSPLNAGLVVVAMLASLQACSPAYRHTGESLRMRSQASQIRYSITRTLPHSETSFTEGLLFHDGHLVESTGQYGSSAVRVIDASNGREVTRVPDGRDGDSVRDRFYGEGLAWSGAELFQLSWKSGVGVRLRYPDLGVVGTFAYKGEGWGLCNDGTRFVRSDGSSMLHVHGGDFAETGKFQVSLAGYPVAYLNELECSGNDIYANLWKSPFIVRIDTRTGNITGVLDLQALVEDVAATGSESVLNGIALDPQSGELFVTGKNWKKIYVLKLLN